MEVKFYKQDSYLEMRGKFTGVWANLRLVIHYQSEKFWRGSDDELEDDHRFFPPDAVNEMLFTLTGVMTTVRARYLFAENYRVQDLFKTYLEPFIYGSLGGEFFCPTETETLDECSQRCVVRSENTQF